MKLLMERWRRHLNEICDASIPPFDFELKDHDEEFAKYVFNSTTDEIEGSEYFVRIKRPPAGDVWEIEFNSEAVMFDGELTSEGQPLKIMSTVIAAVKDFIDDPELNRGILKFFFEGAQKDYASGRSGHSGTDRNQRTKLYMLCLKNQLPGTKPKEVGENAIFFEVPEE